MVQRQDVHSQFLVGEVGPRAAKIRIFLRNSDKGKAAQADVDGAISGSHYCAFTRPQFAPLCSLDAPSHTSLLSFPNRTVQFHILSSGGIYTYAHLRSGCSALLFIMYSRGFYISIRVCNTIRKILYIIGSDPGCYVI